MSMADAAVDHRHDHIVGRVLDVPTLGGVDVCAGHAAVEGGIVQIPKRAIQISRIVWGEQCLHCVIRLRVLDDATLSICSDKAPDLGPLWHLKDLQVSNSWKGAQN